MSRKRKKEIENVEMVYKLIIACLIVFASMILAYGAFIDKVLEGIVLTVMLLVAALLLWESYDNIIVKHYGGEK